MLLVTITYGVVETSFLFRDGMVVSSASRAGARVASSLPRDSNFASSASDQVVDAMGSVDASRITSVWVYKADATTGLPDSGSFASCGTCVKYRGTPYGLVADGAPAWTASSQNACAGSQDSVGVYVQYRYPSRLGFFFGNQRLQESTVMRLEPYDRTGACRP